MILWPILALMTLTAMAAVWWPLARRQKSVRSGSDVAVYRDQLDEIDRDETAGLVGGAVYLCGAYPKPNSPNPGSREGTEDHGSLGRHPDQGRAGQLDQAA